MTSLAHLHSSGTSSTDKNTIKRRPVACTYCHTLKVRCIPSDPQDPKSECVRCAKSGRDCVILPSRRKRQKPDPEMQSQKIAELEQKIQQLSSTLKFYNAPQNTNTPDPRSVHPHLAQPLIQPLRPEYGALKTNYSLSSAVAQTPPIPPTIPLVRSFTAPEFNNPLIPSPRIHSPTVLYTPTPGSNGSVVDSEINAVEELETLNRVSNRLTHFSKIRMNTILAPDEVPTNDSDPQFGNTHGHKNLKKVIGPIISEEDSRSRFEGFLTLHKILPIFNLKDVTYEELKQKYPILLLSILTVTSITEHSTTSSTDESVRINLKIESTAYESLTYELLIVGSKSLELLQSMILLGTWYNSAESFHHRRYHYLIGLSVTLAADLGLTTKAFSSNNHFETPLRSISLINDPNSKDNRRLILALYCSTLNISVALRRPLYVSWSKYVDECCDILGSDDSSPDEIKIVALARISHVLERVYRLLHMPSDTLSKSPTMAGSLLLGLSEDEIFDMIITLKQEIEVVNQKLSSPSWPDKVSLLPVLSYSHSVRAFLYEPYLMKLITRDFRRSSINIGPAVKGYNFSEAYENSVANYPGSTHPSININGDNHNNGNENGHGNTNSADPVSPLIMNNVLECASACYDALNTFLLITTENLSRLPIIFSCRIIYICGMALRLRYLALLVPSLALVRSSILEKVPMKFIHRIQDLLHKAHELNPHAFFLCKLSILLSLFRRSYASKIEGFDPDELKPNTNDQQLQGDNQSINIAKPEPKKDTGKKSPLAMLSNVAESIPYRMMTTNPSAPNNISLNIHNLIGQMTMPMPNQMGNFNLPPPIMANTSNIPSAVITLPPYSEAALASNNLNPTISSSTNGATNNTNTGLPPNNNISNGSFYVDLPQELSNNFFPQANMYEPVYRDPVEWAFNEDFWDDFLMSASTINGWENVRFNN